MLFVAELVLSEFLYFLVEFKGKIEDAYRMELLLELLLFKIELSFPLFYFDWLSNFLL